MAQVELPPELIAALRTLGWQDENGTYYAPERTMWLSGTSWTGGLAIFAAKMESRHRRLIRSGADAECVRDVESVLEALKSIATSR